MMDRLKDQNFWNGLCAGLFVAGVSFLSFRWYIRSCQNKYDYNNNNNNNNNNENKLNSLEQHQLLQEQVIRNRQFFGDEGQNKVEQSYIVIFGVGGVGSHVLSACARAGVGKIDIIDFDRISLSSLNRHAFATRRHVNRSKVEIFKDFFKELVPNIDLTIHETYVTVDNVEQFFNQKERKPDFVIDCIDNLDAKAALVAYCVQNQIRIISSCGAGMKADPTRIQIRDISETSYDSLAKALRMKLKKYKIYEGFKVVYSSEQTERELLPLKKHQEENAKEYAPFKYYRVRIIPVLGTMPALMGYIGIITVFVILNMIQFLFDEMKISPQETDDVRAQSYNRLYQLILSQARKLGIEKSDLQIDMEDIYIIVREVYKWECFICGRKCTNLELVQWDREQGFTVLNLIPLFGLCSKNHQEIKDGGLDEYYKDRPQLLKKKQENDFQILKIIETRKVILI